MLWRCREGCRAGAAVSWLTRTSGGNVGLSSVDAGRRVPCAGWCLCDLSAVRVWGVVVRRMTGDVVGVRAGGLLEWRVAGRHLGPVSAVLPFAINKGAIHQMTLSLSDALIDRGITVNRVDPGRSTPAGPISVSLSGWAVHFRRAAGAARKRSLVWSGGRPAMTVRGSLVRSSIPRAVFVVGMLSGEASRRADLSSPFDQRW